MVNIGKINEFGQELNQLIIDKSDYKHTNRILRLTEKKLKGTNYHTYSISVDWSVGKYAAIMELEKEDITDLIQKLTVLVESF